MLSVIWISSKRSLVAYSLVFRQVRSPYYLGFGCQAKRCLWIGYQANAVSMPSVIWVLVKRDLHDACDLVLSGIRVLGERGLHVTYGLGIGQTRSPYC
jgi:hypothetical protein